MRHLPFLLLALMPVSAWAQAGISTDADVRASVHFATASAEIDPASAAILADLCERIGDREPWSVKLSGHTDDVGSGTYNEDLSHRRVEAVRALLAGTCPELAFADIDWRGETRPVASNGDDAGRALNRRVDVVIGFEEPEMDEAAGSSRSVTGVTPLFAAADKVAERFTMDAAKDIDITTQEGWTVHIDGGSMVDALGRPVSGQVEVSCRAFLTPMEAIASGIPMFVGKGNDAGHMESAGMFEVLAFADQAPLSLQPGRNITIGRPVERIPGAEYKDYMLDPITGQWQQQLPELESPVEEVFLQPVFAGSAPPISASLISDRRLDSLTAWWVYKWNSRQGQKMPDTLTFRARKESEDYALTTRCYPLPDERGTWRGRVMATEQRTNIPEIMLRVDRRFMRDHGKLAFRVMIRTGWLHPEWSAFGQDKLWVYDGPMDRKAFISDIATKHLYQDIELVALDGEDSGTLRLKSQGQWVELPVDLSSYRHRKSDAVVWSRQLDTYQRRLAGKEKQFDNHLRSVNSSILRRISNQEKSAYAQARGRMRPDELAMDKAAWIQDCQLRENRYQLEVVAAARAADPMYDDRIKGATVMARFTMSGFGIYNCDRILPREGVQAVIAVVDEQGVNFPWHTAYGVVDGRTAVITFWGSGKGSNDNMLLSRDMSSLLFVGRNNEVLVVNKPTKQVTGRSATLSGIRSAEPKSKEELDVLVKR